MKKLMIITILTVCSFFIANQSIAAANYPDYCYNTYEMDPNNDYSLCSGMYDTSEGYTSVADGSEYDRIEKIDGIWYGVIEITDYLVEPVGLSQSYIFLSFSRDLESLVRVTYDWELRSCIGVRIENQSTSEFNCWGFWGDMNEGTVTYENEYDEGTAMDFWFDKITNDMPSGRENYDWKIWSRLIERAMNIEFTYILTEQEITDLKLDIQEQFEDEKNLILENSILSQEEKLAQISALVDEYETYQIDFGDEMTSVCIDDTCDMESIVTSPDDVPTWTDDLVNTIVSLVGVIVSAVLGVSFVGVLAYIIVRKAISTTGEVSWITLKGGFKTGAYIGSNVGNGILKIFNIIGEGFKAIFTRK